MLGGCSKAAADAAARETRPRAARAIALNSLQGAEEQGLPQAVVAAAFQQVVPPLLFALQVCTAHVHQERVVPVGQLGA